MSDEDAPRRRRVHADEDRDVAFARTLRDIGLSNRVASAVVRSGRRLRSLTRHVGVEHAALLDTRTGAAVGDIISGDQLGVDIRPHLLSMEPGRTYVQIHAHPRSMPPSDQDIALFAFEDQL